MSGTRQVGPVAVAGQPALLPSSTRWERAAAGGPRERGALGKWRPALCARRSLQPWSSYARSTSSMASRPPSSLAPLSAHLLLLLPHRGLAGAVPPALTMLPALTGLYLHYNSLSGEIPRELSALPSRVELYLGVNNPSDPIPDKLGRAPPSP
eukprot:XP_023158065.1 polygalacturonase inhibitor-like [Zea mays]